MRLHRKVWLWHGRWWAVQLQRGGYFSIGIHLDWDKPYLDLHLWQFIMSIGNNPVMGHWQDRTRGSCRGMLRPEQPELPVL